jgi:GT2 family glycosyltransferase
VENLQQKKWPNVSVIIVNWNGEQFLNQCLSALTNQTVKPYEIILVDNASSDGSIDIVRRFSNVRLIALDHNAGFAQGSNLAIKETSSQSEWIAIINPDAFAESNWLEKLIAAALRNPEYDVFACKLLNARKAFLLDGAGDAYHVSGRVWRLGKDLPALEVPDSECEVFSPCAAAALYRKDVFSEANGFDEDFFCYVEDVDLGFRLRLLGYNCLFVPDAVAYHVGSTTTGSQHSDFAVYHGHRNLVWTYIKNMPGILFWGFLPIHLALNFITVIYFILRGQGRIILRAKWDAIKGIPRMWRKRRDIQKNRKASTGEIWRALDKRFLPGVTQIRQG